MKSVLSSLPASFYAIPLAALMLAGAFSSRVLAADTGLNVLPAGQFNSVMATYVPWAGVDDQNCIHGIQGNQIMVNDAGHVGGAPFGPSVAVADLNGDGKNDLIVADTYGFFWYFPNTGTPQAPAFTQGEVIPIWLGLQPTEQNHMEGLSDVVPRIQLVDFSGTGKKDVVAGTYGGYLAHVPNVGSSAGPNFLPTYSLDSLMIPTRRRNALWCNYLAPFFTNAFGSGNVMDLIMGEGTYSANSIWLLHNTGTNDQPGFDEDHINRVIPGMGIEQLTPQVVDWNNDGKPDVICGDRTGFIDLFLNTSSDPSNPTFAPAEHIKIGGQEKQGKSGSITVTVCDLSNNHLPNLLIGKDDGTIVYAVNHGTLGHPDFSAPATPLKGVLPPTYHYTKPTLWRKWGVPGAPYELLGVTNPQLEPGFAFPEGVKSNYALKFWVWPYKNLYFQRYYPKEENEWNEHVVHCDSGITIKMNTRYKLHFWVLAPNNSVSDFHYRLATGGHRGIKWAPPGIDGEIPTSSSWTEVTRDFEFRNDPAPTVKQWGYDFGFTFHGEETFYIDDLEIEQED
jgi:hypothetical protein